VDIHGGADALEQADHDRNNRQVPIGEALQCLATGGVAGTVYTLTAIVVASDGQTLVGTTRVRVVAD
jgi:hypothetical protein